MSKSASHVPARRAKASRPAAKAAPAAKGAALVMNFVDVFRADPMERVNLVKKGVPAQTVDVMAKRMAMPKERLVGTLGLARATVDRKARENKPLSTEDSSRVLGMARLVGQVQVIVEESGNPDGFDAAGWVARWLERPLPALGGQRPAELMDTPDGQSLVSDLVARMQSAAYS
jgi:putative toxin-antitoxin system antitoxin component (TIGR02293 family)